MDTRSLSVAGVKRGGNWQGKGEEKKKEAGCSPHFRFPPSPSPLARAGLMRNGLKDTKHLGVLWHYFSNIRASGDTGQNTFGKMAEIGVIVRSEQEQEVSYAGQYSVILS